MAIVGFTGFETGDSSETNATGGTISYSTSTVIDGVYSLRTNPTTTAVGYYVMRSLDANGTLLSSSYATLGFSFIFRYATKPGSNSEQIFCTTNLIGTVVFTIRINSSGNLEVYNGTTLLATGSATLSSNTNYRISGLWVGSSGDWEIKIDGSSEASGTATFSTSSVFNPLVGKYENKNSQSVDFFFDAFIIDDANEPTNGELRVSLARTVRDGGVQQWTSGTNSSDWQEVDEVPPGASTYVMSSASTNQTTRFGVQSSTTLNLGDTIVALKPLMRIRENATGTSSNKLGLYNSGGGIVSQTTAFNHTTTTATRGLLYVSSPSLSTFDGYEVGSLEENAIAMRAEWAGIMVLYDRSKSITSAHLSSTIALYPPTVTSDQSITSAYLDSTLVSYPPSVAIEQFLYPSYIPSQLSIYSPYVVRDLQSATGYGSTSKNTTPYSAYPKETTLYSTSQKPTTAYNLVTKPSTTYNAETKPTTSYTKPDKSATVYAKSGKEATKYTGVVKSSTVYQEQSKTTTSYIKPDKPTTKYLTGSKQATTYTDPNKV